MSAPVGAGGAADDPELLRVVSGDATHEEIVALVTALAAAATTRAGAAGGAPVRSRWADPAALLGLAPAPGPGAWAASRWRR